MLLMIIADNNLLILFYFSAFYTAYRDTSHIFVIINRRNQHLQRAAFVTLRRRNIVLYCFKQHLQILSLLILGKRRRARTSRTEYNWTFKLILACVKVYKQIKNFIRNLIKSGIRAVNLVYHNNDAVLHFQSLLQNKSCLRHWSLSSINQQNNSVHHLKNSFYLTAEVGMSRRINYIHLYIFIIYRCILCQNRYSSFSFKVVAVHNSLLNDLIFSINSALL